MRNSVAKRFSPLSDHELELYVAGAADNDTSRRVERQAANDPPLASYLAEREAERRAFYALRPSFVPSEKPRRKLWLGLSTAALVAAAAMVMVVHDEGTGTFSRDGSAVDGTPWDAKRSQSPVRAKGGLGLRLVVERQGQSFDARPETIYAAGDRLQLVFTVPTRGRVTLRDAQQIYFDFAVEPGTRPAPSSLLLDAAAGPEQLQLVFTPERGEVETRRLVLEKRP